MVIVFTVGYWMMHLGVGVGTKHYSEFDGMIEKEEYFTQSIPEENVPDMVMVKAIKRGESLTLPVFDDLVDQGSNKTNRMIIKTASFEIEIENPETTFGSLRTYIKINNGFIESSSVSQYGYNKKSVYLRLRVPSEKYEEIRDYLNNLGYVKSQSEGSDDVTETHIDYVARLANLKAQEDRVRNMYDRAKEISDVISLESELTKLRDKIERLERQVKNLEKQSSFSTITVSLVPELEDELVITKEWNVSKVWKKTVNALKTDLKWWFELVVSVSVYSIIWGPIFFVVWLIRRFLLRRS